jgi:autotransporter-associated beta strand protein
MGRTCQYFTFREFATMPTWIPAGNGNWNTSTSWSGGVPNGVGAGATFNFSLTGGTIVVGTSGSTAITLGTLNVTLTGTSNLLIQVALGSSLIFDGGAAGALVTINNSATTGTFLIESGIGGNIQLASNTTFNVVDAGGRAVLIAPIIGSGILFKTGNGTLDLDSTNSFDGGIRIQGGILDAAGDFALGSGPVQISNNAAFRSIGTIDQTFHTIFGATGTAGSAQFLAANSTTMNLVGALNHLSQGTINFGSATNTGTIIASFSSIVDNPDNSSYRIAGGTLRFGDAFNAANLLLRPGQGLTELTNGGILDTAGFNATISNIDFDAGTIRSSAGALNVTVVNTFTATNQQTGTLEGTAGVDQFVVFADFGFSFAAMTLTNWTAGADLITINGSANDNNLAGSTGNDTIIGYSGNDTLFGVGGIDTLIGSDGNDTFVLASSGSFIIGGSDIDTLRLNSGNISIGSLDGIEAIDLAGDANLILTGAQFATGLTSNASLDGAGTITINMALGDKVLASGMTALAGSAINFVINGSTGVDVIKANINTTNTIFGGDSTDQIRGGSLVDTINGGIGNDKILGFGGADILTGGAGADKFRYLFSTDSGTGANADTITDFVSGTDQFDFRLLDPDPVTPGVQTFAFVGTVAFSANGSAQIRYIDLGADLRVQVDLDGNGTSDMEILLTGAGAGPLLPGDFLL